MAKAKAMWLASAKGSCSRASSPGASPKSVVENYELEGIPIAWDNESVIRERIRENMNLCLSFNHETGKPDCGHVDASFDNLRLNAPVLKPLVALMKVHDLQLPSIDKLIAAVDEFFQVAKLSRSTPMCYQEAWAIRRMIVKLKKYIYRNQPPQDQLFY